jgi:hypothetical protein
MRKPRKTSEAQFTISSRFEKGDESDRKRKAMQSFSLRPAPEADSTRPKFVLNEVVTASNWPARPCGAGPARIQYKSSFGPKVCEKSGTEPSADAKKSLQPLARGRSSTTTPDFFGVATTQ